jgi:GTP-binding protein HflX
VLVPFLRRAPARAGAAGGQAAVERSSADRLEEATGLARAIDLDVRASVPVPLARTNPATLLGSGKVAQIKALIEAHAAELVIVDHSVSPIQQRNLEKAWGAKVLDRTGLILEIFGRRARTKEGRLQVELAHLTYQKSRLVRSWTHLERQRGGFGFLGGPGETQIETDRRLIQERIDGIRKELDVVIRTRELHRAGRRRVPYPLVAIVGYTNAGKSTLFNRLTGAAVEARDQVFVTLDPTMREVRLESGRRLILSDTVGFISDLPTTLVAAFRATLEEVLEADIILHVRDISHAETEAQRADVEAILEDLGISGARRAADLIEVWNKTDLLAADAAERVGFASRRADPPPRLVSARTGAGLAELLAEIDRRLGEKDEVVSLRIPPASGGLLAWLHANAQVLARETAENGDILCRVRIERAKAGRLASRLSREGLTQIPFG